MTGHRGDERPDPPRDVQRAVDRPQPEWPHQAGEQARWGRGLWPGQDGLVHLSQLHRLCAALRLRNRRLPASARRTADRQRRDARFLPARRDGSGRQDGLSGHPQSCSSGTPPTRRTTPGRARAPRSRSTTAREPPPATARSPTRSAPPAASMPRLPSVAPYSSAGRGAAALRPRVRRDRCRPERRQVLSAYDAIVMANVNCLSDAEAKALDALGEGRRRAARHRRDRLYDEKGVARDKPALSSLPIHRQAGGTAEHEGLLLPRRRRRVADPGECEAADARQDLLCRRAEQGRRDGADPAAAAAFRPGRSSASRFREQAAWRHRSASTARARPSTCPGMPTCSTIATACPTPAPSPHRPLAPQHRGGTGQARGSRRVRTDRTAAGGDRPGAGARRQLWRRSATTSTRTRRRCTGSGSAYAGVKGDGTALVAGTEVKPESGGKPDAAGYLWYALPPIEAFEAIQFKAD